MSPKEIKWVIYILPTVTVAAWEYIRHQWLLPFLSMEAGNWLTAIFVFVMGLLFYPRLFAHLETIQEELQQANITKASLQEREKLARELHDGIAQSLFLLSVKVGRLRNRHENDEDYALLHQTIREAHDYVRQAISNLRQPVQPSQEPWTESLRQLKESFEQDSGIPVQWDWKIPDKLLSPRTKVELYASVREALHNIRKHADAQQVWVSGQAGHSGWRVKVEDDGKGFTGDPFEFKGRFGLQILKARAAEMGWSLTAERRGSRTCVEISMEGDSYGYDSEA